MWKLNISRLPYCTNFGTVWSVCLTELIKSSTKFFRLLPWYPFRCKGGSWILRSFIELQFGFQFFKRLSKCGLHWVVQLLRTKASDLHYKTPTRYATDQLAPLQLPVQLFWMCWAQQRTERVGTEWYEGYKLWPRFSSLGKISFLREKSLRIWKETHPPRMLKDRATRPAALPTKTWCSFPCKLNGSCRLEILEQPWWLHGLACGSSFGTEVAKKG